MGLEGHLARFPPALAVGTEKPGTYTRVEGHFAVRGALPNGLPATPVARLEAEDVVIYRGAAPTAANGLDPAEVMPVYATGRGAPLSVPTGEVFVRLVDGVAIEDRSERLESAGYAVAKTLAYAPQAAWLRARSGRASDALRGIPALEALPEVASVEPQMLSVRARR